ncbi:hypothetical protein ACWCSD_33670 [Nonomuraea sp. NPDC001684]
MAASRREGRARRPPLEGRPARPRLKHHPLFEDPVLFDLYMRALTGVLDQDEIRSALDELGVSPNRLRSMLVTDAGRVLALAPEEFAAYEMARTATRAPVERDPFFGVRWAGVILLIAGVVLLAAALAANLIWTWGWVLFWAGGTTLIAAGATWAILRLRRLRLGQRIFSSDLAPERNSVVTQARDALIRKLARQELLAQIRTRINTMRAHRADLVFAVTSSPGLSDIHDSLYEVPTRAATEIESLVSNVTGISLGIAGPRGCGKSTIIRHYCGPVPTRPQPVGRWERLLDAWEGVRDGHPPAPPSVADVRCLVSAPVDYAARDFVLHLFANFCRQVIVHFTPSSGGRSRSLLLRRSALAAARATTPAIAPVLVAAAALLVNVTPWTLGVAAGVGLLCLAQSARWWSRLRWWRARSSPLGTSPLVQAAKRNLVKVRHLQSHSATRSAAMRLPVGLEGQYTTGITTSEQPLSHPEVVEQFRGFARRVAALVHAGGGRVFIGVDELDKIGSADQAERFVNELKGVFGVPYVHFLVSVSDDALETFERRGIPLRDAFDSSFDEIVRVGRLSYAESRRLLFRRVIGLSEPYVGLCHVLSGGIARDLIRAARKVVQAGTALTCLPQGAEALLEDGVEADSFMLREEAPPAPVPAQLADIAAAIVNQEISRKAMAFTHALTGRDSAAGSNLLHLLHEAANGDIPSHDLIAALSAGEDGESPEAARLRVDYAAFVYFCQTVRDVFDAGLDDSCLDRCTRVPGWEGGFDALGRARAAFSTDSHIAWRMITGVRRAWNLSVFELPAARRPANG